MSSVYCRQTFLGFVVLLASVSAASGDPLRIEHDKAAGTIAVFRTTSDQPILTQNAKADFRPFIHPIVAPDGTGVLTEYSPGHHKHQTGLYWGFTRVNGRDFFHHPEGEYWRRVSAEVMDDAEDEDHHDQVQWRTVYELLDNDGNRMLTETQIWTMHTHDDEYVLDLEWTGEASADVTIGEYDYGGLFLRMPWREGIQAQWSTVLAKVDARAEGQTSRVGGRRHAGRRSRRLGSHRDL